jgi:NitT/TauT family transport system permease protein
MKSELLNFRTRKFKELLVTFGLSSLVFVVLFSFWEYISVSGLVDPLFTSSPTRVVATGLELIEDGTLLKHAIASARVFAVGFSLAVALGVPLGVALGWFRWFNRAFSPLVSAFYTMPRIALMPIFIIWFGLGMSSKVALITLSAIFPIIVNMQVAMHNIDQDFKRVGAAYGASQWQLFKTIALPSSVPFLLTGLRLAMGRGLLGVVAAEVFGGSEGLGYMIMYGGATFQIDIVFVGVVVIAGAGIVLDRSLLYISRRVDSWKIVEA